VTTETFVGSDNHEGGRLAGQYVVKTSGGKARVGILEGIPGHETGDSDTVFAASDLMALGAIEAIAAAGKTGKIRVIGFDALDDAKKAIAAGTMEASVAQFPYEMGRVAVESAVKVMRGEKLPADINVKLELVTKENVQ
jgi:ribose transport system substrate-binding protein